MSKKIIPFEEFEAAVMNKILQEDTIISPILREQYQHATIGKRFFSGAGFFTDLIIPEDIARIYGPVRCDYGNVSAIINDIYGYGFILFIHQGAMCCLEGYTWMDSWPKVIENYSLKIDQDHSPV